LPRKNLADLGGRPLLAWSVESALQATTVDRARRVEIVHEMQRILYEDDPYVVLYYGANLQGYRADRWSGWELAPVGAPAVVMNYMRGTYMDVQPVAATEAASGRTGTAALVAIVLAVVILIGIVLWLVRRRKPGEVEGA